jgi:hypothetical protein
VIPARVTAGGPAEGGKVPPRPAQQDAQRTRPQSHLGAAHWNLGNVSRANATGRDGRAGTLGRWRRPMVLLALDTARGDAAKPARAFLLDFLQRRPLDLAWGVLGCDFCSGIAQPADAGGQFGDGLLPEGRHHAKASKGKHQRRRRSNSHVWVAHWDPGHAFRLTATGLGGRRGALGRWRCPRAHLALDQETRRCAQVRPRLAPCSFASTCS